MNIAAKHSYFGSKLGFSRILNSLYGTFWRCSRVRLYYNSAESEPILMKSGALWVFCRGLALADFGCDPRSIATAGEPGKILFFLSDKQLTISLISRRPIFTKLEHNTSIGVAMKTFRTEFWKFYRKASFFHRERKIFSKLFNVLRLQAAITPQWLQIAGNSLAKTSIQDI